MRNLIIFGFFIMLLVMVQFAQAQTVDDVINKHIDSMGGKAKLLTLTSVKMTGGFNTQGYDVSVVSTRKHGVGYRLDFSVAGTENYQFVTPTKGSAYMPVLGQSSPEDLPEDQMKMMQNQMDLQGPFLNYKEKGNTVELGGKESVDGIECYKLNVTFKNGNHSTYYIDTKSNRIYKLTTKLNINGEEREDGATYSNYKQNADGYWFAYTSVGARGETNYEKIETNVAVDDSVFKN